MTEPWVSFRYEYVSGVVTLWDPGQALSIFVANRGGSDDVARVFVSQGKVQKSDSNDHTVAHGDVWLSEYFPQDLQDGPGLCWVRILTTSLDLVPSIQCWRPSFKGDETEESPTTDVYFAPGDFDVFPLHYFPGPRPVPGPVESAN